MWLSGSPSEEELKLALLDIQQSGGISPDSCLGSIFTKVFSKAKSRSTFPGASGPSSPADSAPQYTGRVLDDLFEIKLNSQLFNLTFPFVSVSLLRGEYMAASFFNSVYSMLHFTMH